MSGSDKWILFGSILSSSVHGVPRIKIITSDNVYEMQMCYFDQVMQRFALRINDRMNPKFDYLRRLDQIEKIMKSGSNSVLEMRLKRENEILREMVERLEGEIAIMRHAIDDVKVIKEPLIFDGIL
jgi:hypothetical protein